MLLLSTKYFKNNDEFIEWQKEGVHLEIRQITPLITGFSGEDNKSSECNREVNMHTLEPALLIVYLFDDMVA